MPLSDERPPLVSTAPYSSAAPDTRPRGLGLASLVLGVVALVLTLAAILTSFLLTVGLVLSIIALVVGAAAITLGIIVVVKRSHGFTIGGILGIVGGVLAGFAWLPFFGGLLLIGLSGG